jgi:hypothetical protein
VAGDATQPKNHASMLESSVGIPKTGSYRTGSGSHGMAYHLAKPATLARFDVIVQKYEHFPSRRAGAAIKDTTEIELYIVMHDLRALFLLHFSQEFQRGRLD